MQKRIFQERLIGSLQQFAGSPAVEYGHKVKTYAELDESSDKVAGWILKRGIKKGTFFGILTDNRLELVSIIIGVMKAGCVIVPLFPGYPEKRLGEMIRSTNLRYVIGDERNVRRFVNGGRLTGQAVEFIVAGDIYAGEKNLDPLGVTKTADIKNSPEDPLYIHFTSGTTGVPKAIVGKNKSLLHFIEWEIETFAVDRDYRIAQFTVPGFDPLLRDIFAPLFVGGVVCIPENKDIVLNAEALKEWVERQGIDLIHCVYSQFRLLNSSPLPAAGFKDLKYIIMAGEKMNPADLSHWYDALGERIQLVNCYGTSEATMFQTCHLVRQADVNRERIPVGKPIRGNRIIILDERMNICEALVPGEIYIRTPYMSCGYYNNPQSNKERFIPNPFSANPEDLLYKTGDQGMFLPDGNIDFLGRLDRQVKIRGNRIEPEEIESILMQYPGIEEAAVAVKEAGNNKLLTAYIVKKEEDSPGQAPLSTSLEEYLQERLPVYMIPANIITLKKMPRNAHAKVDFAALPDPLTEDEHDFVPPRDDTERGISKIWCDILGLENISINSNFFKIGGNSLNLMTLTHQVHKAFDVKIPLGEIFKNPTISQQAELVKSSERAVFVAIEPAAEKPYYVLSAAQRRMYILNGLEPGSTNYNLPMAVMLEGSIDIARLEGTFAKIIDRHENLRAGFGDTPGYPAQKIYEPGDIEFKIEYYEVGSGEQELGIIERFIRPFDLSAPPLLRVGLIPIEDRKNVLMVDMHHIISDGSSLELFRKEFMALYAGEELSPLSIHYKDYAEWQNSAEQKEKISFQEEYWLEQFSGGVPVLNLPTDYPRPSLKSYEGSVLFFNISREEAAILNRMALEQETTLYMVLLAIFFVFLRKISGQEDIITGTPTAGRRHADLEPVIGMFINTLGLRNYPRKEKKFREFLHEVKTRTLDAFENQDYQLEDLVEKLNLARDLGRNPLFDVMFSLQNMTLTGIEVPGLKLIPYEYEDKTSKFDLILMGFEVDEGLTFSLEYSTKLFKKSTIERFIGYFQKISAAVSEDIDIELQHINLVSNLKVPGSSAAEEAYADFGF
jgi:amino acid adenylation domain-containing protein